MKCKKCGAELKDTDKICLNCGSLVSNSVNDLYDDINVDEDEDNSYLDDNDTDEPYNKELEDLLNSYENSKKDSAPDYSSFDNINDDNDSYVDNSISKGSDGLEDNIEDDFEDFNEEDNSSIYNSYGEFNEFNNGNNNSKGKIKLNLNRFSLKIIVIIAGVVLLIIGGVFGYKYLLSKKHFNTEYKIEKEQDVIKSKYSLTKYPNYIKNHTWICGDPLEDGSLTTDRSTYFQYDFNKNGSYAREFLNREDTYEDGTYNISLEDISNDQYTYKLIMLANLDGGYKTRYTFTIITNKEGTKATYKYNSRISSCEEMEYYNNKYR